MAINPNLVGVPAQSKNLDTATTTTTAGLVHRQVISLADPETATNYARVSGGSLQVSVQNTTLAVTQSGTFNITNISGTVSLPTGAKYSNLQTTGNTSLNSIDTQDASREVVVVYLLKVIWYKVLQIHTIRAQGAVPVGA